MKHLLTITLCFFVLSLSAQEDCQGPDFNNDGEIGSSDLIVFLSFYGNEWPIVPEFNCGETVTHQDYAYQTVQIGDQCWFAENLRSTHYANGDMIQTNLSDSAWGSYPAVGRTTIYGYGEDCLDNSVDIDACDTVQSLLSYARLYNWYAVSDARNVCPSGWHVPSDDEWMELEVALGMGTEEAASISWRGTDQGDQLKTTSGWYFNSFWDGNGTDSSGFSALPGGLRYSHGAYATGGASGYLWSVTGSFQMAWYRRLSDTKSTVFRNNTNPFNGFSVRCLKD